MNKASKGQGAENRYHLSETGHFVIEDYNSSIQMASFLPGIAGTMGIPMWVFYVNRGQGVTSFGVDGKDSAIVEFFSANRAYQLTPLIGFRTFYRINGKDYFEPFQRTREMDARKVSQRMTISSYNLKMQEINKTHGIETKVKYFTVPSEPVSALCRSVKIKNLGTKPVRLEILDGLPQIVSYGLIHIILKDLTKLTEAWVKVEHIEERNPYYKLSVAVSDKPQVQLLEQGNFYFTKRMDKESEFSPIISDPVVIFDDIESFTHPGNFLKNRSFSVPLKQRNRNFFPCAFSHNVIRLKPGEEARFVTMIGNARNYGLMKAFKEKCSSSEYITEKERENRAVIGQIQDHLMTVSSHKKFDAYAKQCYLDNVLRGGYPHAAKTGGKPVIFHIFSRRHGDLERDYNRFQLLPTYFSQGNGNYRDVNQNRRNDIQMNPDSGESTIRTFMNLIQLDGYNPLVIKGAHFWIEKEKTAEKITEKYSHDTTGKLKKFIMRNFTPGELLVFVEEEKISLKTSPEELLSRVLSASQRREDADHGEGFWSDHWTYNLDLIESYFSLYPERRKKLFFEEKDFIFFENSARVRPRREKYFLTKDGVRQFHSVFEDKAKHSELLKRKINPFAVRTEYGKGKVYTTSLFVKFLSIVINKAALLDPSGVGIELEADKPNWYDALNGLPGLLGSSVSETYELKRLVQLLHNIILSVKMPLTKKLPIPEEIEEFFRQLSFLLKEKGSDAYIYWDRSHDLLEAYREKTANGISGKENSLSFQDILDFFKALLHKLEKGTEKAVDPKSGIPYTYFINEVTDHEVLDHAYSEGAQPRVKAKSFVQKPLPLFLEGPVHAMRCEADAGKVYEMHQAVSRSPLFDKKLKMYKVNTSLEKETYEIGRTKIFPSGWLENESIWLHMEYKYILELLKKGLYDEFFKVAKNVMIPNLDAGKYGRSILENSSFLVSSAYYDESMHGRGFVARLSGSTAEFMHIWLIMAAGKSPFRLDAGKRLVLKLEPVIPGEFFTTEPEEVLYYSADGREEKLQVPKNAFAFKFLGSIPVIYSNPKRINTWKPGAVIKKITVVKKKGKTVTVSGSIIKGQLCQDIRNRDVVRIEAEF